LIQQASNQDEVTFTSGIDELARKFLFHHVISTNSDRVFSLTLADESRRPIYFGLNLLFRELPDLLEVSTKEAGPAMESAGHHDRSNKGFPRLLLRRRQLSHLSECHQAQPDAVCHLGTDAAVE
jgi:hypothetical protein